AVGVDLFEWPNPEVLARFKANGRRCGVPDGRMLPLKADSGTLTEPEVRAAAGGRAIRLVHVDGEHSRKALVRDLKLANALIADGGLIVLDDMLHPGYPTLMVTVQMFLEENPDLVPLCVIDRESIVGATKFVLCGRDWFKRYEGIMLEAFKDNIWPLGADFEPHWCLVLSLDTRLAAIT
ncbi:MAG: class I SAM-dependent methyltransferase, partial [Beijerinckiaceae bacterium]